MILLLLLIINNVDSITQADRMRIILEYGENGQNTAEMNRDLESKLPPIGHVAGE